MHRKAVRVAAALAAISLVHGAAASALAAQIARTGSVKVVATVRIASDLPEDTELRGSVFVNASDPEGSRGVFAEASLRRSGATATATVTVPYSWTLSGANVNVRVSFSVSAGNRGASTTIIIPLPANGATAEVNLPVAI